MTAWIDHLHRVRVERHQHGRYTASAAGLDRVRGISSRAPVHAVKCTPDGEHASAPIRRDVPAGPALHDRKAYGARWSARRQIHWWALARPIREHHTAAAGHLAQHHPNAGGTVAGPRELARVYRTIGLKLYADH